VSDCWAGSTSESAEDVITAIVRPYGMTPEDRHEAFVALPQGPGSPWRLLAGLKRLPDE